MSSVRPSLSNHNSSHSSRTVTDSKADLVSMELSENRQNGGHGDGPTFSSPSGIFGHRTRLEKLLIITLGLFFVALMVVIGLAISRIVTQEEAERKWNNLCNTPGCIRAANTIILNMDATADPCEDFYQYACGGFHERVIWIKNIFVMFLFCLQKF